MPTIDGLITGLDTTSIVEGLLAVQQSRIDRINLRRQDVATEQTAFKTIEANLLGLQGSLNRLLRTTNGVFQSKLATSSDEEAVLVAAAEDAAPGVYRLRVTQLALSHQVASGGFASASAEITTGNFDIRVGNGELTSIVIDGSNNTVQGLVDGINNLSDDVTAAVINDGSGGSTAFRILLSSNKTGAVNTISITNGLGPTAPPAEKPVFDFVTPVQAATNAEVQIGEGAGAILAQSDENRFDDMIQGINLDVLRADVNNEITITVSEDTAAVKEAVEDFVDAYNGVIEFINARSRFDAETGTAGLLLGSTSASSVVRKIRDAISEVVHLGPGNDLNLLSTLGISTDAQGKLVLNASRLDDILEGREGDYTLKDVQRLFALDGVSSNPGINFMLGNHRTKASDVDANNTPIPFDIDITQAAEQAVLLAANSLAPTVLIDASNDEFNLKLDGTDITVSLPQQSYTRQELADKLTDLINGSANIQGREVLVGLSSDQLEITSLRYGSAAGIVINAGNANATLGLNQGDAAVGKDVQGVFRVPNPDDPGNPFIENATGVGRVLTGDLTRDEGGITIEQNTADLRIRVDLDNTQIGSDPDATMSITRGIAGRLDLALRSLLEANIGELATIDEGFDRQIELFDSSIDRLNEQFEARQASILREFAALESAVSQLQSTGNVLATSLLTLPVLRT